MNDRGFRAVPAPAGLALLGLFPAFEIDNPGGIQVSGRLAWEAIERSAPMAAYALQLDLSRTAPAVESAQTAVVHGRLQALWHILRGHRRASTVLCWHSDLLPFANLARGRRVLFLHGIEVWRGAGKLGRPLQRRLDLLLANSEYTLRRAQAASPPLRRVPSAIVPLGVSDTSRLPQLPDDPPAAIMIGRLDRGERYKGHEAVLAAWIRVRQQIPSARLWIVGAGDLRRDLQQRVRAHGLTDAVRFFGRVAEADKDDLLARSRCLVMPSRAEGFGLVYAEAMRAGRPCLVGTHDAAREVVNPPQCGLAADPDDIPGVAEAIIALLTPGPQWQAWSTQARQRYLERYTAPAFQARLLAALGLT